MPYGLVQTSAPAKEPVSVAEAKGWLKVDLADDDTLIEGLVASARAFVEDETGRQLMTATYRLTLDCFPGYYAPYAYIPLLWDSTVYLPRPPAQSVTSITYADPVDSTGATYLTLAASRYRLDVDSEPARLTPVYGNVWPVALPQTNAVKITFTAGYGTDSAALPPQCLTAMRLLIANWYENRGDGTLRTWAAENAARALLTHAWPGCYR